MNTLAAQILTGIAFLLTSGVMLASAGAICFFLYRCTLAVKSMGSDIDALADAIDNGVSKQDKTADKLSDAMEKLSFIQERTAKEVKSIQDLPQHVLAYAKMAAALVKEIQKFRVAVDNFRSVVVKDDGRKMKYLIPEDEDAASTIFEIQSLLASHPEMTEEEARMKVEEADASDMQMSEG